jgi:hypothetical protein
LMVVDLKEISGSLQVASIRPLFELFSTMYLTAAGVNQYDVTRGGNQFVVDSVIADESTAPLNLVVNWSAELKSK